MAAYDLEVDFPVTQGEGGGREKKQKRRLPNRSEVGIREVGLLKEKKLNRRGFYSNAHTPARFRKKK